MNDRERLEALLRRIDGRSYPAYRDLRGVWDLGQTRLSIDHTQGDPFASPSRLRIWVQTGVGPEICRDPVARLAAEDWLLRRFGSGLEGKRRGSGRSGLLGVYRPGPEVVERSALRLHPDGRAEVRCTAGLPARGRKILGREARDLLIEDLPHASSRLEGVSDSSGLAEHIASVRNQQALRSQLIAEGLVAFVANGSILPRASGVSQAPLEGATSFTSPPSFEVTLTTPGGEVRGMGIRQGVSLIVGGGFHGKSTLLHAIQRGHLDHRPGDGRCGVVALPETVKVRAEDGRFVAGVDISSFLGSLPGGRSTSPFSTDDASGSTSQAAAIMEALEGGGRLLLVDEDTSATNLLVRDARMRQLVPDDAEPITPFVQRVRQLYEQHGVSTLLVIGGVGDYLAVSDQVIQMIDWRPHDVTERARALGGAVEPAEGGIRVQSREISRQSLRPTGKGRVRARDQKRLEYGSEELDLSGVEQIIDGAAAASIGHAIRLIGEVMPGAGGRVSDLLDGLEAVLCEEGADALSPYSHPSGYLIRPRRHEVAAAISRLRCLIVRSGEREL